MRQDLTKLKKSVLPQLVAAGLFAAFLQGPRCLRVLEQVLGAESGGGPEESAKRVQPGTWVEMLTQATAELPYAVIAADMYEPGAKLVCVNRAFEKLTGYDEEASVGRNCRFLQGAKTEPQAVQQLVDALRMHAGQVQAEDGETLRK